jgi:hypothetical protein
MQTNAITRTLVVTQSWVLSLGSFSRLDTLVSDRMVPVFTLAVFQQTNVKVLPM